jgi:hypothetical protein
MQNSIGIRKKILIKISNKTLKANIMSFETNEVKETPQPKEEQELKVKEEPERKSEPTDSDENDGLKVKETPEQISYVQSAEDNEKYKSDLRNGDDVPQPDDGRFVASSESMDKVLNNANESAVEHKENVNKDRADKLEEEIAQKPWENIEGFDSLEEAEKQVPKVEPKHDPVYQIDEVEARNQLVEEQLGKPEHSLGDEQIYRTDVNVTDETVLEKPKGDESTNNGMGVADGVDEYVLKSPETHDDSKVSKY